MTGFVCIENPPLDKALTLQLLLYELKYINSSSLNITIINIPCQIIKKINIISKKCRRLDDKMLT